jgi:hypothetical protein
MPPKASPAAATLQVVLVRLKALESTEHQLVVKVSTLQRSTQAGTSVGHPVYVRQTDDGSVLARILSDPVALVTALLALVTLLLAVIPLKIRLDDINDAKAAAKTQVIGILGVFRMGLAALVTHPTMPLSVVNVSWGTLTAELFRNDVARSLSNNAVLQELYQMVMRIQAHVEKLSELQGSVRTGEAMLLTVGMQSVPDTNPQKAQVISEIAQGRAIISRDSRAVADDLDALAKKLGAPLSHQDAK